jgi:hypothetical protein
MTHSEAMEILGHMAVKLEMQMRFEEREAIEYAIGKLTQTPKDPMALARDIYQNAIEANDMYKMGLIS